MKVLLMNSNSRVLPNFRDLKPSRRATYPGKTEASVGTMRGPTTLGELMVITDITYDESTDKTTVGYAYSGIRI